jgi:hypothetical protein
MWPAESPRPVYVGVETLLPWGSRDNRGHGHVLRSPPKADGKAPDYLSVYIWCATDQGS